MEILYPTARVYHKALIAVKGSIPKKNSVDSARTNDSTNVTGMRFIMPLLNVLNFLLHEPPSSHY